jgi:hypothetical protein
MGTANFPLPQDLSETLELLNATGLNLAVVEQQDGRIRIITGDQLAFATYRLEEAEAFFAGCFLSTFMGNSLQHIRDGLQKGNFVIDSDWPEMLRKQRDLE